MTYGKTRSIPGQTGVYYVIYSFTEERVGIEAGELAMKLVRSLLPPELPSALPPDELAAFDFFAERDDLISRAQDIVLGPTTASLVGRPPPRFPAIRLERTAWCNSATANTNSASALCDEHHEQHRGRYRQRQRIDDPAAQRHRDSRAAPSVGPHPRRSGRDHRGYRLPAGDQAARCESRPWHFAQPDDADEVLHG